MAKRKASPAEPTGPIPSDVLVAGAGAAGLVTAIGLARSGVTVRLIGVPEAIRDDARSAALFHTSFDVLDRFGLGDAIRARGAPLAAIRLVDATGALFRAPTVTFRAAELGRSEFGWNVPNAAILEALLAAARGTPGLTLDARFATGLVETVDGVRLSLSDGEWAEGRVAIGADGQNSKLREAAGIGATIKPYPQVALTARLRHDRDHEDISTEFHTREGPFTLVPLGPGRSALVWICRPERAEALRSEPAEAFARRVERQSSGLLGRIGLESAVSGVPMRKLRAETLARGRVALVGEAGHAFPPIGAQGLNLGLRDVEALIERLVRAHREGTPPGPAALAAYASDRRLDVEARVAGVDLMNSALLADFAPADAARALGLAALGTFAPLRRLAMRLGAGEFGRMAS